MVNQELEGYCSAPKVFACLCGLPLPKARRVLNSQFVFSPLLTVIESYTTVAI